MRPRFVIFLLVSLLIIVALIFWRRPVQHPGKSEPVSTIQPATNSPASHTSVAGQGVPHAVSPQEVLKKFVEEKNAPINVYGQFLDQDSNAIPGVNIKVSIRQWTVPDPSVPQIGSKGINLEEDSDASGRFEIYGENGDGIDVESIRKDGYRLSPKAPNHFGPSSGSFENPVIIEMWKEGAKAPLIGGSYVFGLDSGKTYTLNLITGKKIEGEAEGDLRVVITRPNGVGPRDKFLWSFSIEAIQGGFAEPDPNDGFMYVAPESSYQPRIEMQFDPSDPAWVGIVKKRLFIRSRGGQVYGRAQIEIDSIYNAHSAIQIDYAINPTGSRNLQP